MTSLISAGWGGREVARALTTSLLLLTFSHPVGGWWLLILLYYNHMAIVSRDRPIRFIRGLHLAYSCSQHFTPHSDLHLVGFYENGK